MTMGRRRRNKEDRDPSTTTVKDSGSSKSSGIKAFVQKIYSDDPAPSASGSSKKPFSTFKPKAADSSPITRPLSPHVTTSFLDVGAPPLATDPPSKPIAPAAVSPDPNNFDQNAFVMDFVTRHSKSVTRSLPSAKPKMAVSTSSISSAATASFTYGAAPKSSDHEEEKKTVAAIKKELEEKLNFLKILLGKMRKEFYFFPPKEDEIKPHEKWIEKRLAKIKKIDDLDNLKQIEVKVTKTHKEIGECFSSLTIKEAKERYNDLKALKSVSGVPEKREEQNWWDYYCDIKKIHDRQVSSFRRNIERSQGEISSLGGSATVTLKPNDTLVRLSDCSSRLKAEVESLEKKKQEKIIEETKARIKVAVEETVTQVSACLTAIDSKVIPPSLLPHFQKMVFQETPVKKPKPKEDDSGVSFPENKTLSIAEKLTSDAKNLGEFFKTLQTGAIPGTKILSALHEAREYTERLQQHAQVVKEASEEIAKELVRLKQAEVDRKLAEEASKGAVPASAREVRKPEAGTAKPDLEKKEAERQVVGTGEAVRRVEEVETDRQEEVDVKRTTPPISSTRCSFFNGKVLVGTLGSLATGYYGYSGVLAYMTSHYAGLSNTMLLGASGLGAVGAAMIFLALASWVYDRCVAPSASPVASMRG